MNKEKALELRNTFPSISDQHKEEMERYFDRYLTYNKTAAHCMACNHDFSQNEIADNFTFSEDDPEPGRCCCADLYRLDHKNFGLCPYCNAEVQFFKSQDLKHDSESFRSKRNFMVFLAAENRLYIRCFTVSQYLSRSGVRFEYIERQRYILCSEGFVRFGPDEYETYTLDYNGCSLQRRRKIASGPNGWTVRTRLTEPVFNAGMWNADNSYDMIGEDAISDTYARYSCEAMWKGGAIDYLRFWNKHKNAEYLLKAGYEDIVEDHMSGCYSYIDWKQNDLKKMMRMNGNEFNLLRSEQGIKLRTYLSMRNEYPGFKPEELIELYSIMNGEYGTFATCLEASKLKKPYELYRYLRNQKKKTPTLTIREYSDYIRECKELKYDMKQLQIRLPKNLYEMHMRTSEIIAELQRKADEAKLLKIQKENAESIKKREFIPVSDNDLGLMLRIPSCTKEIVDEGKTLNHCVGSYAKRHNEGYLTIAFIRTIAKPDVPYYTMEISSDGEVVQCRGFKNAEQTKAVKEFVNKVKTHLADIYETKKRVRKSA
ncbi:MAG: PcfJ domain-containing protein [Oscillospiraceae bacterium]|nr:PcfJ domain-containing protein [Oscillospiraceae bacterium]